MKNQKQLLQLPMDACPDITVQKGKCKTQAYGWRDGTNHIYSMRIIDNAGSPALITTIFDAEHKPIARIFLDDYKWITQFIQADGRNELSEGKFEYLSWYRKRLYGSYVTDKQSEQEAGNFFKKYKEDEEPIDRLKSYQAETQKRLLEERYDRIRESVDNVMLLIRPMPKDFEKWVNDEALFQSRYIFYEYKKGRASMDGYCTVCNTDVQVKKPHHNQPGKCPHCGKKIVFKARKISTEVYDETRVAYIQKLSGGWVIRYFYVIKKYYGYGHSYREPELWIREEGREFDTVELFKTYRWDNFRQTGEYRFCEQYSQRHLGDQCYLYTRNLKKLFKNDTAGRKYFPFADVVKRTPLLNVSNLLIEIVKTKQLEYLAKMKLYNLVAEIVNEAYSVKDIINLSGKNPMQALGVGKSDIPYLQKINPDAKSLQLYKATVGYGAETAYETVKWYQTTSGIRHAESLCNVFRLTTPHKAIRYLTEQSERLINSKEEMIPSDWCRRCRYQDMRDVLQTWKDYLDMSQKLGYDMKNEFVLFPLHLTQAHDQANADYNERKEEIKKREREGIAGMRAEMDKQYRWHNKQFLIRAPKDYTEIIAEGQKLHHCVGSYVDAVAARETVILFIRKTEDPGKPFVTLEFKNRQVTQCYGHHDTTPPKEVLKFVETWQAVKKPGLQSTAKINIAI